jgi:hypothetical protein
MSSNKPKQSEREALVERIADVANFNLADGVPVSNNVMLSDIEELADELLADRASAEKAAKDDVLKELLDWYEYWRQTNNTPFNWYGAIKAIQVSKDFKKPFNTLAPDTTEGGV